MRSLRGLYAPVCLIVLWQGLALIYGIRSDSLAAPVEIASALVAAIVSPSLWLDVRDTVAAATLGLLVGGMLGFATGISLGLLPPASRLLRLTIEVLRPVPAIALAPIAILVFGFGYTMEIAIVAFATFFPMLILTESAVGQIAPRLSEVARALNLSAYGYINKIVIPSVIPRVFIALRLAAGLALIVAITVEIAANPIGLGNRLIKAGQSLRPAEMFATLFLVCLLGWLVNWLFLQIEKFLFPKRGSEAQ